MTRRPSKQWQHSNKPLPSPTHCHASITKRTWPNNYLWNPYKDRGATGCTVISETPSSRSIAASQHMQWCHSDVVAANTAQFKRQVQGKQLWKQNYFSMPFFFTSRTAQKKGIKVGVGQLFLNKLHEATHSTAVQMTRTHQQKTHTQ